jgi:hypothetical protein
MERQNIPATTQKAAYEYERENAFGYLASDVKMKDVVVDRKK